MGKPVTSVLQSDGAVQVIPTGEKVSLTPGSTGTAPLTLSSVLNTTMYLHISVQEDTVNLLFLTSKFLTRYLSIYLSLHRAISPSHNLSIIPLSFPISAVTVGLFYVCKVKDRE